MLLKTEAEITKLDRLSLRFLLPFSCRVSVHLPVITLMLYDHLFWVKRKA